MEMMTNVNVLSPEIRTLQKKHRYMKLNESAQDRQRRRIIVAEINILRKFEGKLMIEERIDRSLGKLHKLWFNSPEKEETTGKKGLQ